MRVAVRQWVVGCALWMLAGLLAAQPARYQIDYQVGFDPARGEALVEILHTPGSGALRRLRLQKDPDRHGVFKGDGRVTRDGDRITWRPPQDQPGRLRFRYQVNRERGDGAFDARITDAWALLRADRLIPPVRALADDDAEAVARFRYLLPAGWSNAELGYPFDESTGYFRVDNPGRRFQQPVGWMIAGEVGSRREFIAGMEVVVAAPKGDAMRRNDILAFLNASVFEAKAAFGRLPPKLLIVGAGDPMWRGGLSAPNSMYLHADRPLVGEAGTSPLLHELTHVVTRIRGAAGQDWIAEGFAEYYSIELARRSGLVSESRTAKTLDLLRQRGSGVRTLAAASSEGARTARAVILLQELDAEIRAASDGAHGLDAVTRRLVGRGRISLEELRAEVAAVAGAPSAVLSGRLLGE